MFEHSRDTFYVSDGISFSNLRFENDVEMYGAQTIMNQLKQIRLENKWTQQYVADKIGITKSAYSNIENQNRSPSLKVAIQLQNLFGLSIEKLLENKNSNPTPTKV